MSCAYTMEGSACHVQGEAMRRLGISRGSTVGRRGAPMLKSYGSRLRHQFLATPKMRYGSSPRICNSDAAAFVVLLAEPCSP